MRPLIFALLTFTPLVFVFAPLATAGIVFEIETKENTYPSQTITRTRVSAQGTSMKMVSFENTPGGQQRVTDEIIYHDNPGEILIVDHQRRSYMTMDRQFVEKLTAQLNMMRGQAGQGMSLPLQQQHAAIEIHVTDHRATIYGYRCVLIATTRNGHKVRDTWVTEWRNINGGLELVQTFDSMSEFFLTISNAMPTGAKDSLNDTVFATLKKLRGFPVATREYRADGTVKSESALRSAQQVQLNPNVFDTPQGFQSEPMFSGDTSLGRRQPTGQANRRPW